MQLYLQCLYISNTTGRVWSKLDNNINLSGGLTKQNYKHGCDQSEHCSSATPLTQFPAGHETGTELSLGSAFYLIRVLTLATSMSYSFLTACLIWCLLALTSTMNTSVLLSSIFFMADSVVKGNLMMAQWSNLQTKKNNLGPSPHATLCRYNHVKMFRWVHQYL